MPKTLESLEIRSELFKLFYESGEFALHSKADAFEAFDKILGLLHGWLSDSEYSDVNKCIE